MRKIFGNTAMRCLAAVTALFLLAGCVDVPADGGGGSEQRKEILQDDVTIREIETGLEGAETVRVLSRKPFVDGDKQNGYWQRTDYTQLDPRETSGNSGDTELKVSRPKDSWDKVLFEYEHTTIGYRYFSMDQTFSAGDLCRASWGFSYTLDAPDSLGEMYCSLYFADIEPGDDPFGQKVTVLKYFSKRVGTLDYATDINNVPGTEWEREWNRGHDKPNLKDEQLWDALGYFPRMISEGDKIYIVMDISDGENGSIRARDVYEYTWINEPYDGDEVIWTDEDYENDPDYMANVYDGCWDLTDIIYVGDDKVNTANPDVDVRAERRGLDGQEIVYTFTVKNNISETKGHDCTGEVKELAVPEPGFSSRYYAGGFFREDITIFKKTDKPHTPGNVICSLALCDVEFGTGKYGVKITPRMYFSRGYPAEEVQTFSPGEERMSWRQTRAEGGADYTEYAYTSLEGSFPNGEADGEKMYLVYGLMDTIAGDIRMYDIYEYTWQEGPVTEWVYNPPMYD
ncbi:MAG: hypothetical protein K5770_10020 [Lachnospiraceae bacterium]|nr:hypothetical protein [Lachnospiraceae bacterium]